MNVVTSIQQVDLILRDLRQFETDDWHYAFKRVGHRMQIEYHARQASQQARELRAALQDLREAIEREEPSVEGHPLDIDALDRRYDP